MRPMYVIDRVFDSTIQHSESQQNSNKITSMENQ
jgi:hypothetical protein